MIFLADNPLTSLLKLTSPAVAKAAADQAAAAEVTRKVNAAIQAANPAAVLPPVPASLLPPAAATVASEDFFSKYASEVKLTLGLGLAALVGWSLWKQHHH